MQKTNSHFRKFQISLTLLFILNGLLCAQTIVKNYGGKQYEYGKGIALDNQKNTYLLANYQDTVQIDSYTSIPLPGYPLYTRFILSKHNSSGNLQMIVEPKGFCEGSDVAIDNLGNIYITGSYLDSMELGGMSLKGDLNTFHYFMAKLNSSGKLIWIKECQHLKDSFSFTLSYGRYIRIDKNFNVYVVGDYNGTIVIGSDTLTQLFSTYDFLIKYDSLGNILWTRNEAIDYFEIDLQGNYIIGRDNYYIRKFDDAGGIIWTAHSSKNLRAMAIDGLGNIYAPTNGSQLNKYANSDGHLIWQKPLQPNNIDKIAADSLGNVVTACWTVDSTRNHPAIIDKYNINGDFISKIIWGRRIDPTKDNLLYVYELVYDHGIVYFTGQWGTQDSSKASVVFNRDTLTSKGNYDVIFISTSDQLLGIPSAYIISNPELSCYPNPFTNNFKVRFPFTKEDELRVFNIYGEAILNLKFNIGNDVEINTDDWSLGIYILEVFCTDKRYSYKLIKK